jgi:ribosomal-protein-alanine N-acetyltransferase
MQSILDHPPTIETDRLLLRPLTMADEEAVYSYGRDPEVTKYMSFETHNSIEDSRTFLRLVATQYANHEPSSLGIIFKEKNLLIGSIGYLNWSNDHKRIEIGYVLLRDYWNKGIISEAVKALVDYLFDKSDLVRIEARCLKENTASARVMEKIGMQCEGILRKQLFAKGEYHDMKIYSILRDEWRRENNY